MGKEPLKEDNGGGERSPKVKRRYIKRESRIHMDGFL